MSVRCDCCVLSSSGLSVCKADESSRGGLPIMVCVCVCEASIMRRPWHTPGCCLGHGRKVKY